MHFYPGTVDAPAPWHPGFAPLDAESAGPGTVDRASGLLGELPAWHYVDEFREDGLHRFFAYELPSGQISVGALRYVGVEHEGSIALGGAMGFDGAGQRPASSHGGRPAGSHPHGGWTGTNGQDPTSDPNVVQTAHAATSALGNLPNTCNLGAATGAVSAFKSAWNAWAKGLGEAGPPQIPHNGLYDQQTADDLSQALGGANVPAPCSGGGGQGGGGGGQTTNEPIPVDTANCHWVATTDAAATAIAQSISYHDTPVKWTDQGHYDTTIAGTPWTLVMWYEGGKRNVATFKCTPPGGGKGGGAVAQAGFGVAAAIVAGLAVVGGLAAAAAKKKAAMGERPYAY